MQWLLYISGSFWCSFRILGQCISDWFYFQFLDIWPLFPCHHCFWLEVVSGPFIVVLSNDVQMINFPRRSTISFLVLCPCLFSVQYFNTTLLCLIIFVIKTQICIIVFIIKGSFRFDHSFFTLYFLLGFNLGSWFYFIVEGYCSFLAC